MLACGFPDDGLEDELRGVHNDITRLGIHSFFFFFLGSIMFHLLFVGQAKTTFWGRLHHETNC